MPKKNYKMLSLNEKLKVFDFIKKKYKDELVHPLNPDPLMSKDLSSLAPADHDSGWYTACLGICTLTEFKSLSLSFAGLLLLYLFKFF